MHRTDNLNGTETSILAVFRRPDKFSVYLKQMQQKDYCVVTRSSVFKAVADFSRDASDIVIIDADGLENELVDCVRVLRDVHSDVFILILHDASTRSTAVEGLREGADALLLQPFYPEELIAIVDRWALRMQESRQSESDPTKESLSALVRMAKGVAHEINNPLTTLAGWLEVMEQEEDRPEAEKRRLTSLLEETERIAETVDGLLEFGQEIPGESVPINLTDLLQELIEGVEQRAGNIRVDNRLSEHSILVHGNRPFLQKACRIIMDDAVAAVTEQGRLQVRSEIQTNGWVNVQIRDDGNYLSDKKIKHIFEPFGVEPRDREKTTVAYAAACGIIKGHGGDIHVDSSENGGTEFTIKLPITTAEKEICDESSPQSNAG